MYKKKRETVDMRQAMQDWMCNKINVGQGMFAL